jgi:hypothetical protein
MTTLERSRMGLSASRMARHALGSRHSRSVAALAPTTKHLVRGAGSDAYSFERRDRGIAVIRCGIIQLE